VSRGSAWSSDSSARSTSLRRATLLVLLLGLVAAGPAAARAPAVAPLPPLQTAIVDPDAFGGADAALELTRAANAGATVIKVPLFWNSVAPATEPARFTPSDPDDPSYNWGAMDAELKLVESHGLTPLVYVSSAPTWAMRPLDGFPRADPQQFGAFALAAVKRYSGASGLPRVRYWEAWNEPNKVPGPTAKASAPGWYREIVNAFATSVHTRPGNLVVAGGLAPFGISTALAPLTFMRGVLCLKPACNDAVHFDIWSTNPYTAGGPTHHAVRPDDVSIADLPKMKAVLDAADAAGHVVSAAPVRFWVTEFSWDSDPPDPAGVPTQLEGRWVAEALYRMWTDGVSLVTWFTIRDHPITTSPYQSGLYYAGTTPQGDRPKPALTAFRFPFVAYAGGGRISVWGRTPTSKTASVAVEQRTGSRWTRVATLRADAAGIFSADLRTGLKGPLRAVVTQPRATSLPFSLVRPPDATYQPFGT
jgi:hypothetical protein